jgi:hypothetical protein
LGMAQVVGMAGTAPAHQAGPGAHEAQVHIESTLDVVGVDDNRIGTVKTTGAVPWERP